MGEEWDDSLQSKEQIEAGLLSKHEAAMRRERALAYAFSHQVSYSQYIYCPLFTMKIKNSLFGSSSHVGMRWKGNAMV